MAVIAGVLEQDFARYYDVIMPMLKHFIMNATGEKENRLRGKAFECMSLLGTAVGKEKFMPDAQEALTQMMRVPVADDDVQKEYIKEASERICQCLKKDFAAYLPMVLPGVLDNLRMDKDTVPEGNPNAAGGDDDDDEEYISVNTGDGKLVKVKTSKFESMQQSVELLLTITTELEGAFFDHV